MTSLIRLIKSLEAKISIPALLWIVLTLITAFLEISRGNASINNYYIFTGVIHHLKAALPLYMPYPTEYFDVNHYGPLFGLIIAPFAIFPAYIGCLLWCLANTLVLYYAIQKLELSEKSTDWVLWICLIELLTATHNVQFNPMLTACILFAFTLIKKQQVFWGTLFIVAGTLTKIYGIVGLAFFFFTPKKTTFIFSFLFWMLVCLLLPLLVVSPNFLLHTYLDWFKILQIKNQENIDLVFTSMQDISVMGMIRRIFHLPNFSNLIVLVPAAMVYLIPLLSKNNLLSQSRFQHNYLAALLIGTVIFSTSAESSTYIIALVGVAIWFIHIDDIQPFHYSVLTLVIVFTSLSATDLFPKYVYYEFIKPYSLKALPCFLVWIMIMYDLLASKFSNKQLSN